MVPDWISNCRNVPPVGRAPQKPVTMTTYMPPALAGITKPFFAGLNNPKESPAGASIRIFVRTLFGMICSVPLKALA
jgi:hypothetical protein